MSPRELKSVIDAQTEKFRGLEQRDAHEFLSDLVNQVHDEEKAEQGEEQKTFVTDEFFRISVCVCLTYDSCGYQW